MRRSRTSPAANGAQPPLPPAPIGRASIDPGTEEYSRCSKNVRCRELIATNIVGGREVQPSSGESAAFPSGRLAPSSSTFHPAFPWSGRERNPSRHDRPRRCIQKRGYEACQFILALRAEVSTFRRAVGNQNSPTCHLRSGPIVECCAKVAGTVVLMKRTECGQARVGLGMPSQTSCGRPGR